MGPDARIASLHENLVITVAAKCNAKFAAASPFSRLSNEERTALKAILARIVAGQDGG